MGYLKRYIFDQSFCKTVFAFEILIFNFIYFLIQVIDLLQKGIDHKMSILSQVLILLSRMNWFIFHSQILLSKYCQGFKNNRLFLSFYNRGFHINWPVISINLPSFGNSSTLVILIQLLFELEILFFEDISDFGICQESPLFLVLIQTAVYLRTVIMHQDVF